MASQVYNEFKRASAAGEIDLNADDIRVALLMTTTTADTENSGITTVSGFGTLGETAGANYVRKACATETVTKDDPNNRAEFTFDPITWTALGNGAADLQGMLVYKHVTNDTDSIPICWVEFSANQSPGGSDFTVTPDAEGILQLS